MASTILQLALAMLVASGFSCRYVVCDDDDVVEEPPVPSKWSWNAVNTVDDADASFTGEPDGAFAGGAISIFGDINGDGIDDLSIGDPHFDGPGESSGKIYFVMGRDSGWQLHEPLTGCPSIIGEHENMQIAAIDEQGDMNGDGLADLVIDPGYSGGLTNPEQYLLFGKTSGWREDSHCPTYVDASVYNTNADGSTDISSRAEFGDFDGDGLSDWLTAGPVLFNGEAHIISGADVSAVNMPLPDDARVWVTGGSQGLRFVGLDDVNGDGLSELVGYGHPVHQSSYMLLGRIANFPFGETMASVADVAFSSPDGQGGANTVRGPFSVGDLNGDGYRDIYIAVGSDHESQSGSHFFYGRPNWDSSYTVQDDAEFSTASQLSGPVVTGDDINGDGLDDLVFMGPDETGEDDLTDVYILFSHSGLWPERLELSDVDVHIAPSQLRYISGAGLHGDMDGDGIDDLLLMSNGADWDGSVGAGFVALFCGRENWPAEMTTADADAAFVGNVVQQDMGTDGWTSTGDINGDGFDDFITSSPRHPIDTEVGETFIFFGQPR